jgi:hypothetical protein
MRKFALGVVVGLLFAGLVVLIVAAAAMRFGERPPVVADGSTLVLHLEGELPEQPQVALPIPFLEDQQPMTVVETWQLLRKAAVDSRIKALVLEPRGMEVGCSKSCADPSSRSRKPASRCSRICAAPAPRNTTSRRRRTVCSWRLKTSST